jgi:peroxiredoxin
LPSLEKLSRHFKDKPFSILAINVGEEKETVLKFIEERNLSFTFLLDQDERVSASYGVRSHPMKFLIDKNGNLIGVSLGYGEWNTDDMKSIIQALISP